MAGTLVISLAGLKLQNVEQLVAARGIEKVLVVDSPSVFAGNGGVAATAATKLRTSKPGVELQVAFATGDSTEVVSQEAAAAVKAFNAAGFTVAPPASAGEATLASLVSQASVTTSLTASAFTAQGLPVASSAGGYDDFVESLNTSDETSGTTSITLPVAGGQLKTFSATAPVVAPTTTFLSDLSGGVQVNMTVDEFKALAQASALPLTAAGSAQVSLANPANVSVETINPDTQEVVQQTLSEAAADYKPLVASTVGGLTLPNVADSQNQPLSGADVRAFASQGLQMPDFGPSTQTRTGNYFFYELASPTTSKPQGEFTFTAQEWRSLPNEGVASYQGAKATLRDTADNIQAVLPQLSQGQLKSIGCLQLDGVDETTLILDAATFKAIDTLAFKNSVVTWSDHTGVEGILKADGTPADVRIEATFNDLVAAGIINATTGAVASSLNGDGFNLLANNVKSIALLEDDAPAQLNASQLRTLMADGRIKTKAAGYAVLDLVDSAENIRSFLLDSVKQGWQLDVIAKISNTSLNEIIEIDYSSYMSISNSAINLYELGNLQINVVGTADELNQFMLILQEFPADLLDGVSFQVSDGGEVTVNSALLDALDGRISGAVIVRDDNAGLAQVFDNAIPEGVKAFELVDDSGVVTDLDDATITLTVNELGGMPSHVNADVVLRDTDDQLQRVLRADLDYRVSKIELDTTAGADKDGNSTLDLRIGQLERLLDNGVVIGDGIEITLDARDTLVVNAAAAQQLNAIGFVAGNVVIEDDGNKISSLFEGFWNVPNGSDVNVQLRSFDNAPLALSVAQLEQLVGNFPAFSGAIHLIDTQDELSSQNSFETVRDPRVVAITASDLAIDFGDASRIQLSAEQLEALLSAEEAIGVSLFNGAITLDNNSITASGALPVDGRLELTASQVDLKLQALFDSITETEDNGSTSVFEQLEVIRNEIYNSITEESDNGSTSVIERLNQLAQDVGHVDANADLRDQYLANMKAQLDELALEADLIAVDVAEFASFVDDARVSADYKFDVVDTNDALAQFLAANANLDRVGSIKTTPETHLELNVSQLGVLSAHTSIAVPNLTVVDSKASILELLSGQDAAAFASSLDSRVSRIEVSGEGANSAPLELSVAEYQALKAYMPEARFTLVDDGSAILSQLATQDGRVVAITPQSGVINVAGLDELARMPLDVNGKIGFTGSNAELQVLLQRSNFDASNFDFLTSTEGSVSLTAQQFKALQSLDVTSGVVVTDTAAAITDLIPVADGASLDARINSVDATDAAMLTLNVGQLSNLDSSSAQFGAVRLVDTSANILAALDAGLHANINAIELTNGSEITLSAKQFNSLLLHEQDKGSVMLSGPFKLEGEADEAELIAKLLHHVDGNGDVYVRDSRLSVVNSNEIDVLTLTGAQLRLLGDDYGRDIILQDELPGILDAFARVDGDSIDPRVVDVQFIADSINKNLLVDARTIQYLPETFVGKAVLQDTLANVRTFITEPLDLPAGLTLELNATVLQELTYTGKNSLSDGSGSFLTGEGHLIVRGINNDFFTTQNQALTTLPNSFASIELVVEDAGVEVVADDAALDLLGTFVARALATDVEGQYDNDIITINQGESLKVLSASVVEKGLTDAFSGDGKLTVDLYRGESLESITTTLDLEVSVAGSKSAVTATQLSAAGLVTADALSFNVSTGNFYTVSAADAVNLTERMITAPPAAELILSDYTNQVINDLNNKVDNITVEVDAADTHIDAVNLPADAKLRLNADISVDATDLSSLIDRVQVGSDRADVQMQTISLSTAADPSGETVASLFAAEFTAQGLSSQLNGVAITAISDSADGVWQYSSDAGATWSDLPTDVSATNALYLDKADELRFLPDSGKTGVTGNLTATMIDDRLVNADSNFNDVQIHPYGLVFPVGWDSEYADIASADLNRDGLADFILAGNANADTSGNDLLIFMNVGTASNPSFVASSLDISLNLDSLTTYEEQLQEELNIEIADVDMDSDLDILVADQDGIYLVRNDGNVVNHEFSQATLAYPTVLGDLAAAANLNNSDALRYPSLSYFDYTGNGLKDLVVFAHDEYDDKGMSFVIQSIPGNNGPEQGNIIVDPFGLDQFLDEYPEANFVDLNDDGDLDVLISGTGSSVQAFMNTGDWQFQHDPNFDFDFSGTAPDTDEVSTIAVDINSDGLLDLFTAEYEGNIYLRQGAQGQNTSIDSAYFAPSTTSGDRLDVSVTGESTPFAERSTVVASQIPGEMIIQDYTGQSLATTNADFELLKVVLEVSADVQVDISNDVGPYLANADLIQLPVSSELILNEAQAFESAARFELLGEADANGRDLTITRFTGGVVDLSDFSDAFANGTNITAVLKSSEDTDISSQVATTIASHTADLDSIVVPSGVAFTLKNEAFSLINSKLDGSGVVNVAEVSGTAPADLPLNQNLTYNFDINGTYNIGQDGSNSNLRITGIGADDVLMLDNSDKLTVNADAAEDIAVAIKSIAPKIDMANLGYDTIQIGTETLIGPFGNDSPTDTTDGRPEVKIALNANGESTKIAFDLYQFDSWDGEKIDITIKDGNTSATYTTASFRHQNISDSDDFTHQSGVKFDFIAPNISEELNPPNVPGSWTTNTWGTDVIYRVEIDVPAGLFSTDAELVIKPRNPLQDVNDESFAIGNLSVGNYTLAGNSSSEDSGTTLEINDYTNQDLSAISTSDGLSITVNIDADLDTTSQDLISNLEDVGSNDKIVVADGATLTLTADQADHFGSQLSAGSDQTISTTVQPFVEYTSGSPSGGSGNSHTFYFEVDASDYSPTAGNTINVLGQSFEVGSVDSTNDLWSGLRDVVKAGLVELFDQSTADQLDVMPFESNSYGYALEDFTDDNGNYYQAGDRFDYFAMSDPSSLLSGKWEARQSSYIRIKYGEDTYDTDGNVTSTNLYLSAQQIESLQSELAQAEITSITSQAADSQIIIEGLADSGANLSDLQAELGVTLTIEAGEVVNTTSAKLQGLSGQGIDRIIMGESAVLNVTGYNGTDFSDLLASVDKGAGAVVNVTVDAGDSIDVRDSAIVDLLANVDTITIEGELAFDAVSDNTGYAAVSSKLNENSTGTVNVVNVNIDTDLPALASHADGLTIDVTLKPDTTVDFTDTDANANLAVVNSVYVPSTSTLKRTFAGVVSDRLAPPLDGNDLFEYEFIKAVGSTQPGTLEVDMSDYGSVSQDLQQVGWNGLFAKQEDGQFLLQVELPSSVVLEVDAVDLARFHGKLSGLGDLVVNNYTGEVINSSTMENLNSITVKVAADGNLHSLDTLANLPVLDNTSRTATTQLELIGGSKLLFNSNEVQSTPVDVVLDDGSHLLLDAALAADLNAKLTSVGSSATIELTGFDATDSVPAAMASANVIAVVGNLGNPESVTLDIVDSGVNQLSVAKGSTLILDPGVSLNQIVIDQVSGELIIRDPDLAHGLLIDTNVSALTLLKQESDPLGTITVQDVAWDHDLSGIDSAYTLIAEVATAEANHANFAFNDSKLATVDHFVITDTAETVNVSAAELDGLVLEATTTAVAALKVSSYNNENLTGLDPLFTVEIELADQTVLNSAGLYQFSDSVVDTITIPNSATVSETVLEQFGSDNFDVKSSAALNVTDYTDADLTAITSAADSQITAQFMDGHVASLVGSNFKTSDSNVQIAVKLSDAGGTISAADASNFGAQGAAIDIGDSTLNVLHYAGQDISGIVAGSGTLVANTKPNTSLGLENKSLVVSTKYWALMRNYLALDSSIVDSNNGIVKSLSIFRLDGDVWAPVVSRDESTLYANGNISASQAFEFTELPSDSFSSQYLRFDVVFQSADGHTIRSSSYTDPNDFVVNNHVNVASFESSFDSIDLTTANVPSFASIELESEASITAIDAETFSSKLSLLETADLTVNDFTTQDLSALQLPSTNYSLEVNSTSGANLDAAALAGVTTINVNGDASIETSYLTSLASALTLQSGVLDVQNYGGEDLSGFVKDGGTVKAYVKSVLDEDPSPELTSQNLDKIDSTIIDGVTASISGDSNLEALAAKTQIINGGVLTVSDYATADISGLTLDTNVANQVNVTTIAGAELVGSNLSTATSITLGADASIDAENTDLDSSSLLNKLDLAGFTLTVDNYGGEDLLAKTIADSSADSSGQFILNAVDGATLDDADISLDNSTINVVSGTVTIDDSVVDAEALDSLITVDSGATLVIDGYTAGDLSGLIVDTTGTTAQSKINIDSAFAGDDDTINISLNGFNLDVSITSSDPSTIAQSVATAINDDADLSSIVTASADGTSGSVTLDAKQGGVALDLTGTGFTDSGSGAANWSAFAGTNTIRLQDSIGGLAVRPYNPGDTVTFTVEKDGVSTSYVSPELNFGSTSNDVIGYLVYNLQMGSHPSGDLPVGVTVDAYAGDAIFTGADSVSVVTDTVGYTQVDLTDLASQVENGDRIKAYIDGSVVATSNLLNGTESAAQLATLLEGDMGNFAYRAPSDEAERSLDPADYTSIYVRNATDVAFLIEKPSDHVVDFDKKSTGAVKTHYAEETLTITIDNISDTTPQLKAASADGQSIPTAQEVADYIATFINQSTVLRSQIFVDAEVDSDNPTTIILKGGTALNFVYTYNDVARIDSTAAINVDYSSGNSSFASSFTSESAASTALPSSYIDHTPGQSGDKEFNLTGSLEAGDVISIDINPDGVDAETVSVTLAEADVVSLSTAASAVAAAINAHFDGLTTLADATANDGSVVLTGATGSNITFSSSESISTEVVVQGASGGLVVVNAAAGSVLNPDHLVDATTVKLAGNASIAASDLDELASVLDLNGHQLTVTNYVSGSLASVNNKNNGTLLVETAVDAVLVASDLLEADAIKLTANLTADSTELESISERLTTAFDLAGNDLTLTGYTDENLANISVDGTEQLNVVLVNSATTGNEVVDLDPVKLGEATSISFGTDQPAAEGEVLTSVELTYSELASLSGSATSTLFQSSTESDLSSLITFVKNGTNLTLTDTSSWDLFDNDGDGNNDQMRDVYDDMYDGGNMITTNFKGFDINDWQPNGSWNSVDLLPYTNGSLINDSEFFGSGSVYQTWHADNYFLLTVTNTQASDIVIDGDLGADGRGSVSAGVIDLGNGFQAYYKTVSEEDTDPTVNHMVIVGGNQTLGHDYTENTNYDYDAYTGFEIGSDFLYLLFPGYDHVGSYDYSGLELTNIANAALSISSLGYDTGVELDQNARSVTITDYASGDINQFSGTPGDITVETVDGATLDSSDLSIATAIAVIDGTSTVDASSESPESLAQLAALIDVNSGAKLEVNAYTSGDLSALTVDSGGSVVVTASAAAVFDPQHLVDATIVKLGADASITFEAYEELFSVLDLNGYTLTVTDYHSGFLAEPNSVNGGTVIVEAAAGAELHSSLAFYADQVVLTGDISDNAGTVAAIAQILTTEFDLNGHSLTLNNYTTQDLSFITVDSASGDQLNVVLDNSALSGSDQITLDPTRLADAGKVTFGSGESAADGEVLTSVFVSMADLTTLQSQGVVLDQNGHDVTITNYTSGDVDVFIGDDSGHLRVITDDGADLDPEQLATADSVLIGTTTGASLDASPAAAAIDFAGAAAVIDLLAKTTVDSGANLEATIATNVSVSYTYDASPTLIYDDGVNAANPGFLQLNQDAAILSEIVDINDNTTLKITDYVDRDLSGITRTSGGPLEVQLADDAGDAASLSGGYLATASKITVANGDDLSLLSDANLSGLKELVLGEGSNLLVNGDVLSAANSALDTISGTSAGTENVIFESSAPTDASARESINLKDLNTLTDLDSFQINTSTADSDNQVIAVRLSESLSSAATEINLDSDNGQADYVFLASQIFSADSSGVADSLSGTYNFGTKITGFDSRQDSIGLVDGSSGEVLFERRQFGFPSTGNALDGYVYFNPNTIGDYTDISFVRDQIGSIIDSIDPGDTFGVVIFNDNLATERYDAGLFQVAGNESVGVDPSAGEAFKVLPIANLIDVDALNFTSALTNKFVNAVLAKDGQYDLS